MVEVVNLEAEVVDLAHEVAAVVRRFDMRIRSAIARSLTHDEATAADAADAASAPARALMLQLVFEGVLVRQAREPEIDRALLGEAVLRLLGGVMPARAGRD